MNQITTSLVLDPAAVAAYRAAVEDEVGAGEGPATIPPMAVAALAIRVALSELKLPPGTIHAGQELSFLAGVQAGDRIECRVEIQQQSRRDRWQFLVVGLEAFRDELPVLVGKATLLVPQDDEG